nr:MAG TPA: hypothetical protein [Caudoviricetes sp.]
MGDEVIKVLNHLGDQFGVAIDWSSTNVMPYLNDLMTRMIKYGIYINIYHIIYAIFITALFIIVTIVLYKIAYKMISKSEENEGYVNSAKILSTTFAISLVTTVIVALIEVGNIKDCIADIIELNTVPEKYVVEIIQDKIDDYNESKTD